MNFWIFLAAMYMILASVVWAGHLYWNYSHLSFTQLFQDYPEAPCLCLFIFLLGVGLLIWEDERRYGSWK